MTGRTGKRRPGTAGFTGRWMRFLSSDRLLALIGFGVAGCAALLPWYAMQGGHGLGIRNDGHLRLSGHRDDMAGYGPGGSIRPFGRRADDLAKAEDRLGELATGSVGGVGKPFERSARGSRPDQPFPGRPFRLVHVSNGQALIADDSGMYLVGVGSKLPDKSTLKGFTRQDGRWAIVTSDGEVVGP